MPPLLAESTTIPSAAMTRGTFLREFAGCIADTGFTQNQRSLHPANRRCLQVPIFVPSSFLLGTEIILEVFPSRRQKGKTPSTDMLGASDSLQSFPKAST